MQAPVQARTTHRDRLGRVGSFMGSRLPAIVSNASARSGSPLDIIPASKDQHLAACSLPSSPLDTASSFSKTQPHNRSMRSWEDTMFHNHQTDFAPDAPPQVLPSLASIEKPGTEYSHSFTKLEPKVKQFLS